MDMDIINLFLIDKALAFNDYNVFPNRPENVPSKFSGSGGVNNASGNLAKIIEFIFNCFLISYKAISPACCFVSK